MIENKERPRSYTNSHLIEEALNRAKNEEDRARLEALAAEYDPARIWKGSPTIHAAIWTRDNTDRLGLHGRAILVGAWIWINFAEKPPEGVRTTLKKAGYFWLKTRQVWAHSGGVKARRKASCDPRDLYGAVPLEEIELA